MPTHAVERNEIYIPKTGSNQTFSQTTNLQKSLTGISEHLVGNDLMKDLDSY